MNKWYRKRDTWRKRDAWDEIGDAAVENPATFIVLIIGQFFRSILGGKHKHS